MKKKYESPMAEKYEFNYVENVVASNNTVAESVRDGRTGGSANSCTTGNTSDVTTGCKAKNNKNAHFGC
jgi:hypothetical protein